MKLKNIITKLVVKEAASKILPMDEAKPKLGTKSKAAAVLVVIAGIATAIAEYL